MRGLIAAGSMRECLPELSRREWERKVGKEREGEKGTGGGEKGGGGGGGGEEKEG